MPDWKMNQMQMMFVLDLLVQLLERYHHLQNAIQFVVEMDESVGKPHDLHQTDECSSASRKD